MNCIASSSRTDIDITRTAVEFAFAFDACIGCGIEGALSLTVNIAAAAVFDIIGPHINAFAFAIDFAQGRWLFTGVDLAFALCTDFVSFTFGASFGG